MNPYESSKHAQAAQEPKSPVERRFRISVIPATLSAALSFAMLLFGILLIPRAMTRDSGSGDALFVAVIATLVGGFVIGAILNAFAARLWTRQKYGRAVAFNLASFLLPLVGIALCEFFEL